MNQKLIEELTNVHAATSEESELHSLITKELSNYVDEIKTLKNGSIYVLKKGKPGKYNLMLDAHLDEVALFVTGMTEEGFLRVHTKSIDLKVLPGSIVCVHGEQEFKGIIGLKPYHLESEEETKKAVPIDKLFVDCGMDKESVEKLIPIGSTVTFMSGFSHLNKLISNKSLDDRVGVYTIIEVFKSLKRKLPLINIIGHFSSQEEITGLGAITSTYTLKPDFAIAIDATFGASPNESERKTYKMGKGPVIFIGPSSDRIINKKLFAVADKFNLTLQQEIGILSGTDATEIQLVGGGIPVGIISIPLRYMHTPTEVIDPTDVDKTVNLLSLFIEEIDDLFLEALYGEH
ncbi:MAG: hypothetical protein J7J57_02635 [Caldisericaceae bacterium]|nr:hypothetical protein [Caldisericaceae bacterium]